MDTECEHTILQCNLHSDPHSVWSRTVPERKFLPSSFCWWLARCTDPTPPVTSRIPSSGSKFPSGCLVDPARNEHKCHVVSQNFNVSDDCFWSDSGFGPLFPLSHFSSHTTPRSSLPQGPPLLLPLPPAKTQICVTWMLNTTKQTPFPWLGSQKNENLADHNRNCAMSLDWKAPGRLFCSVTAVETPAPLPHPHPYRSSLNLQLWLVHTQFLFRDKQATASVAF